MAQSEIDRRAEELKQKLKESNSGRWNNFKEKSKHYLRNTLISGLIAATFLAPAAYFFTKDAVTKRQDYPERNVIMRTTNTTKIAGSKEKRAAESSDRESTTYFSEGGGEESKVGTREAHAIRSITGDIEYYTLYNTENKRIASSNYKFERAQAGWRVGGAMNYKEEFAEIVLGNMKKSSDKYVVYKFAPERGFEQIDTDVVEFAIDHPVGANDPIIIGKNKEGKPVIKKMVNRLVEWRNELGFLYGCKYRTGTLLEDYLSVEENKKLALEFFDRIRKIDSTESVNPKVRERLVDEVKAIEKKMKKGTVYASFEDGFFKILPQDGIMYLGEYPGKFERAMNIIGFGRGDHKIVTTLNKWDFFPWNGLRPGRYPGLSSWNWGEGKNKMYPFDKFNNGGYVIRDKYGDIAEIEIKDFWAGYGQDVLYNYYVDLNGNGKIDKKTELINSVVCKTTHDERVTIEQLSKGILPENNQTLNMNYSFMAPTPDMEKGWGYFRLAAYIETMLPDAIHRGQGSHSLLGLINDQRSDIMLFRDLSVENLSRALTQESTLVAKQDIIKVLNAAKRPYARELAKQYGIESQFEGKYTDKAVTREKMYWGPVHNTVALGLGIYGACNALGAWNARRRRLAQEEYQRTKAKVLGK